MVWHETEGESEVRARAREGGGHITLWGSTQCHWVPIKTDRILIARHSPPSSREYREMPLERKKGTASQNAGCQQEATGGGGPLVQVSLQLSVVVSA